MLLSQRLFYHVAAEFSDTFFKHLVKLVGGLFHKIEEANFTKIIGLIKSESGEASFEQIFSSESCRNWKNDETVCNVVIVRPRSGGVATKQYFKMWQTIWEKFS